VQVALVVCLLFAGCDSSSSSSDLSSPDLTVVACAGAGVGKKLPCGPDDTGVCYPDDLTYCVCQTAEWACCGDAVPLCPNTPATPGDFCCPGAPPATLDCPYACSGGHRTVCTCTMDFEWVCGSEACGDGGP
jgi:hypothetical protein